MMRQVIAGIVVPAGILAFMLYTRAAYDGQTSQWHPWALTWVAWELSIILTSGMLGAGLRDSWRGFKRRRQPFEHDAAQLAADQRADRQASPTTTGPTESNGPARDQASIEVLRDEIRRYGPEG